MRNLCFGLTMVATLSGAAIAADTQKEKKGDPDKIVCKVDRSTGSMISDRICKKRSEWDEEKYQARDFMDDRNRVGQQPRPAGPGGG